MGWFPIIDPMRIEWVSGISAVAEHLQAGAAR
jgi:hypothetical protein